MVLHRTNRRFKWFYKSNDVSYSTTSVLESFYIVALDLEFIQGCRTIEPLLSFTIDKIHGGPASQTEKSLLLMHYANVFLGRLV